MAHNMASIGYGFVWPNLMLYSDGQLMTVQLLEPGNAAWESIRYKHGPMTCRVAVPVFDEAAEHLLNSVIQRLADEGLHGTELAALWQDVQAENADPGTRAWRELEASLGYDQGEAPDHEMYELIRLAKQPETSTKLH